MRFSSVDVCVIWFIRPKTLDFLYFDTAWEGFVNIWIQEIACYPSMVGKPVLSTLSFHDNSCNLLFELRWMIFVHYVVSSGHLADALHSILLQIYLFAIRINTYIRVSKLLFGNSSVFCVRSIRVLVPKISYQRLCIAIYY